MDHQTGFSFHSISFSLPVNGTPPLLARIIRAGLNLLMKALKYLSILVLLVVILAGIGVGLLLTPGIQKKIILEILDQPGTEISIERIKIGWGGVEIDSFDFSQNGTEIKFNKLMVELLALSLLTEDNIILNHLKRYGFNDCFSLSISTWRKPFCKVGFKTRGRKSPRKFYFKENAPRL